ncbi:MAG: hypothetical protein JKX91_15775 [Rhizobiaceae bacterium]|nr:hypothetical protein [Rhizobiaceae bacterium]
MVFSNFFCDDPNQTNPILEMIDFAKTGQKGVGFLDALLTNDELELIRKKSFFGGLDDENMSSLRGVAHLATGKCWRGIVHAG